MQHHRGVHPWRQRETSGLQGVDIPLRLAPSPQRSRHLHRQGSPNYCRRCGRSSFFFSVCRTVSREILSTTSSSTSSSARSCNVQRAKPSGGSLHAKAINRASPGPSSFLVDERGDFGVCAPRQRVDRRWQTFCEHCRRFAHRNQTPRRCAHPSSKDPCDRLSARCGHA